MSDMYDVKHHKTTTPSGFCPLLWPHEALLNGVLNLYRKIPRSCRIFWSEATPKSTVHLQLRT
jgi:hypothetical protein